MKKIVSLFLSLVMVLSLSATAFAADYTSVDPDDFATLKETPALTESQKSEMNRWVSYDSDNNQFLIKDGAHEVLDEADYALLNRCIAVTNSNLSRADFSSGEVSVATPDDENFTSGLLKAPRKYSEGVTKIVFHWWGASIYLSKTTINLIGGGVAIGGIWVPEPVVSKVLATLGVIGTLCPGGIAFDYNYIAAGISSLVPGMSIFFPAVRNIRWQ